VLIEVYSRVIWHVRGQDLVFALEPWAFALLTGFVRVTTFAALPFRRVVPSVRRLGSVDLPDYFEGLCVLSLHLGPAILREMSMRVNFLRVKELG